MKTFVCKGPSIPSDAKKSTERPQVQPMPFVPEPIVEGGVRSRSRLRRRSGVRSRRSLRPREPPLYTNSNIIFDDPGRLQSVVLHHSCEGYIFGQQQNEMPSLNERTNPCMLLTYWLILRFISNLTIRDQIPQIDQRSTKRRFREKSFCHQLTLTLKSYS